MMPRLHLMVAPHLGRDPTKPERATLAEKGPKL
jgi:hypothetical protein